MFMAHGFVTELRPGIVLDGLKLGDLIVTGEARLDDRARLCAELDLSLDAHLNDDLRLVAEAWQRWGTGAAEHLLGDWVVVVSDRRSGDVWVARDACGNSACYYWSDSSRLRVATSLPLLLTGAGVPRRPNAVWVAQRLQGRFDPSLANQTAFDGVHQLPGGSVLSFRNGRTTPIRWWYPERLQPLDAGSPEEWMAECRRLLHCAVADRIRGAEGSVGLLLSGGLDSAAVASSAAVETRRAGIQFLGFTSIPALPPDGAGSRQLGNEGPLAQATADFVGGMNWRPSSAPGVSVLQAVRRKLAIHGQPGHAAGNAYWLLDLVDSARTEGTRVLLTGHAGNATISWPGRRTGLLAPLVRAARRLVRRHEPFPSAMGTALARLIPPLQPAPISETDLRLLRFATDVQATWAELGAAFEVSVRDPTADRRLVEFCWRLPNEFFWNGGRGRGLARRAFRGLIPSEVIESRTKGLQAADVGHRLRQEHQSWEIALDEIAGHPLASEWLDVPRMRATLDDVRREVTPATSARASLILARGVGVGEFLKTF